MSGHSKIWILINSLRYQTWDVLVAENKWKCGGETGSSLDCWEANLPNVVAVVEPEDTPHLVECCQFSKFKVVGLQLINLFRIFEYKCFFRVET